MEYEIRINIDWLCGFWRLAGRAGTAPDADFGVVHGKTGPGSRNRFGIFTRYPKE